MDVVTPRILGPSKLAVNPLGFGGGTIGDPAVPTSTAFESVRAAWDSGVRLFDTAPWYGIGRSERRLGMALGDLGVDRDSYVINTKIGKSLSPEAIRNERNKTFCTDGSVRTPRDSRTGFRISFNYSFDAINSQHHDSLQRLGLSRIDTLTIHDIDYGYHSQARLEIALSQFSRHQGGGAEALEQMRRKGTIKAIGCGCNLESRNAFSWEGSAHEDLIERVLNEVNLDFLIIAGAYTLLETRALRRVLPLCARRGIAAIGATPYAGGWLADPEQASYMYGSASSTIRERTLGFQSICKRYDVPLAAAALQFQLAHPSFAAIIPGSKSPYEVQENYRLLNLTLPSELWDEFKNHGLLDAEAPTPE